MTKCHCHFTWQHQDLLQLIPYIILIILYIKKKMQNVWFLHFLGKFARHKNYKMLLPLYLTKFYIYTHLWQFCLASELPIYLAPPSSPLYYINYIFAHPWHQNYKMLLPLYLTTPSSSSLSPSWQSSRGRREPTLPLCNPPCLKTISVTLQSDCLGFDDEVQLKG